MKALFAVIIAVLFSMNVSAQRGNLTSASVKVAGNCGMCKNRIEKAAVTAGAKTATWNADTKILAVTFDPSSTNLDKVEKKIAQAGHDTEKIRADDKAYNALPGCCKYDRSNTSEPSKRMDQEAHSGK